MKTRLWLPLPGSAITIMHFPTRLEVANELFVEIHILIRTHWMPKKKDEPDFKKVKQRVGKKKVDPKATNVNFKSKRVRIQEQSILREGSDVVNSRNKSLGDLVSQFTHFNANTRREAVLGLKELFMQNEVLFSTSVSILISKTIPLILDSDVSVRQAVVNVFESLLPKVPKSSLLPFSGMICVFVNNGMTSINPSIRKSALLLLQCLLKIEPDLCKDHSKILSSLVKLTSEVKSVAAHTQGVLASNRVQMKTNQNQQRSISDLALDTIQLYFDTCFSESSVYRSIDVWSGCQDSSTSDHHILSKEQRLSIPLTTSIYSPSLFLHSKETPSEEVDESMNTTLLSLLSFLRSSMSEILPHEETVSSLSRHLRDMSNHASVKSISITEKDLSRLLQLQELVASVFILLQGRVGKTRNDWIRLLLDLYPVRLTDAHRNEVALRLKLQQVNTLTITLVCLLSHPMSESIQSVSWDHLSQSLLLVHEHDGTWRITTETVVLTVEILHQLCENGDQTERILQEADTKWKELIDKDFGILSLPFMQFYHFILEHHQLTTHTSCLQRIVACLRSVSYSSVAGSKANSLWRIGLGLILSILKSTPSVDESFVQAFSELILGNDLPTDLQSIVTAINSFCSEASQSNYLVFRVFS